MSNVIKFDLEALEALCEGVAIAGGVAVRTLGPGGSTVKKSEYGSTRNTKDGYYAIKDLTVKDPAKNMGVEILKEASGVLNTEVGDNTTSVMVLCHNMIEAVRKVLSVGTCNRNELCKGMEWARTRAFEVLRERSVTVKAGDPEMIAHVATVSANGDAGIGSRISDVYRSLGNALIRVELSNSTETTHEMVDGFEVDRGYLSPYFVNNHKKNTCEFERPFVLIHKEKIDSIAAIVPVLERVTALNRPLFIIAEDIGSEVLAMLVVNKLRGGIKVVAIKSPGYGSNRDVVLEDIAVLTGAKVITPEVGKSLDEAFDCLGEASSVVVEKDKACIVNAEANREAVRARCDQIARDLEQSTSQYDREKLEERFSKLMYGIAVIRVSGDNESHAKERKDLVEDAVNAVRAAIEGGIVAGGGATYSCINNVLLSELPQLRGKNHHDWVRGVEIVIEALAAIEHNILMNAVQCRDEVARIKNTLRDRRNANPSVVCGYDAREHKILDSMITQIMDSTKGARNCIDQAVTAAINVTNTRVLITEAPNDDKDSDAGAGNQLGGMY